MFLPKLAFFYSVQNHLKLNLQIISNQSNKSEINLFFLCVTVSMRKFHAKIWILFLFKLLTPEVKTSSLQTETWDYVKPKVTSTGQSVWTAHTELTEWCSSAEEWFENWECPAEEEGLLLMSEICSTSGMFSWTTFLSQRRSGHSWIKAKHTKVALGWLTSHLPGTSSQIYVPFSFLCAKTHGGWNIRRFLSTYSALSLVHLTVQQPHSHEFRGREIRILCVL